MWWRPLGWARGRHRDRGADEGVPARHGAGPPRRDGRGGVTGLVGANGAGKSTLIKILLGLVPATSGTARVLGHDVAAEGARIRALVGWHARARLPARRRLGQRPGRAPGADVRAPVRRRAERHLRRAAPRGAGRGALPPDRWLLHRHEAARQAGAGAGARPRLVLLDEPPRARPSARDDMLGLVKADRREFGIAVLVTSHLLGGSGGSATTSSSSTPGGCCISATTDFLHATGSLLVEVQGRPTPTACSAGRWSTPGSPPARPAALIEVEVRDETTPDVVRDLTVDLGLGGADAGSATTASRTSSGRGRRQCPPRLSPRSPRGPRRRHPRPRLPPVRRAAARRATVAGPSSRPACAPTAWAGRRGRRCCR